ncbi:hypothetical protein ACT3UA_11515 [Glutamicibacter sp. 363]|uniref:hypothetical protein n=1 Tax=unclassified Glutamicibacter TaxID=2627139 RepID=UPI0040339AF2
MNEQTERLDGEADETILGVLREHSACYDQTAVFLMCTCGWGYGEHLDEESHLSHLAGFLELHEQEARARELESYVQAIEHIDDAILRGAGKDDRWYDFILAEKEFHRVGYDKKQDYVTATVHYAKYRAQQIRDGQLQLEEDESGDTGTG